MGLFNRAAVAAAAVLLLQANTLADPAAVFGARESVQQITLSPRGDKIAYIAPGRGQGSSLYVVSLATGASRIAATVDGNPQRLTWCNWVSNERLLCNVYGAFRVDHDNMAANRLVAMNVDGSDFKLLSEDKNRYRAAQGFGGAVLDWLPGDDGAVLIHDAGVYRLDTLSLDRETVVETKRNAGEFITDGDGVIRVKGMQPPKGATGYAGAKRFFRYLPKGDGEWRELSEYNIETREGLYPLALDSEGNSVYMVGDADGRKAVFRVSLDGSFTKELVFAHEQVDVEDLVLLGRRGRPIGVSYVTDRRRNHYFDEELGKFADSLSKALPGLPLIRFVGASDDESKLLVWAGSDVDPGRYYVYDKGARKLEEIMLARPRLEGVSLAEVEAVSYRAADGTMIPGYLTLPPGSKGRNLPAIVMPHGGPAARDEWGFDWMAQYFAHRGFAVLQPNFRGSAGYGDEWFQENGFQSWRVAIGDVTDAGRWLVSQGIADPSKLATVGWSYGGYAALQSTALDPGLFKAIIAIAPVTDLRLLKEEARFWSNFSLVKDFVGGGAHVFEGSPTAHAAEFEAPVLLFHGEVDGAVEAGHSKEMKEELEEAGKEIELVLYPELDHYLEDSSARADMLKKSDAFLRASMGM